jgi:hypothetical protein
MRQIAACANDSYAKSARAGPRQSASASRSFSAASTGSALRRGAEHLPELRHAHLQRRDAGSGRLDAPELIDQPVARDDLVRMQEQESEQRPLARAGERHLLPVAGDLQRPEDSELHLVSAPLVIA